MTLRFLFGSFFIGKCPGLCLVNCLGLAGRNSNRFFLCNGVGKLIVRNGNIEILLVENNVEGVFAGRHVVPGASNILEVHFDAVFLSREGCTCLAVGVIRILPPGENVTIPGQFQIVFRMVLDFRFDQCGSVVRKNQIQNEGKIFTDFVNLFQTPWIIGGFWLNLAQINIRHGIVLIDKGKIDLVDRVGQVDRIFFGNNDRSGKSSVGLGGFFVGEIVAVPCP